MNFIVTILQSEGTKQSQFLVDGDTTTPGDVQRKLESDFGVVISDAELFDLIIMDECVVGLHTETNTLANISMLEV